MHLEILTQYDTYVKYDETMCHAQYPSQEEVKGQQKFLSGP
jgi:hypothetical protein